MNSVSEVVQELEFEIARLQDAVDLLREKFPDKTAGVPPRHVESVAIANGMTNQQAVDTVLKDAVPDALTIKQVAANSQKIGKELNVNSLRWTLRNGAEAGRYDKIKLGKRNLYRWLGDR